MTTKTTMHRGFFGTTNKPMGDARQNRRDLERAFGIAPRKTKTRKTADPVGEAIAELQPAKRMTTDAAILEQIAQAQTLLYQIRFALQNA